METRTRFIAHAIKIIPGVKREIKRNTNVSDKFRTFCNGKEYICSLADKLAHPTLHWEMV